MLVSLTKKKWFSWALCALITGITGVILILYAPGRFLQHNSFDIPYVFRPTVALTNVVVVYVDPNSLKLLEQPNWPPDRRIYASLIKRLKDAGARMILFDVVFRAPKPDADPAFAEAIRSHGNVLLGGLFDITRQQSVESVGLVIGAASPPVPMLRTNARAWGVLSLRPLDYSFAARRIFTGINELDSLVWAAAKLDRAPITLQPGAARRELWLNFYGPAHSLSGVSLVQALDPQGTPPSLFQGAVVFVGADPSLSPQTGEHDTFATPYSRMALGSDATFMSGVELHATAYENLVRGDYLNRIPSGWQCLIALVWAFGLSLAFSRLRPRHAILLAAGAGLLLSLISICMQIYGNLWWTWLAPAIVQPGLALGLNISYRYAIESRQQKHLRQAFAAYLSPHIADQVAEKNFDLAPGGKEMEVTIMFTDLEGFTKMSETMQPTELSTILTTYFEEVSQIILAQDGTIIKYIGDAVLAVWGAPLPAADQAERAVKAACGIQQMSKKQVFGHQLKTRVGVNSGVALVGNLGSSVRFDYTVIGANVNLASRLEALNKVFGTTMLISESTLQKAPNLFHLRCVGSIIVRGTTKPGSVFEVLDAVAPGSLRPAWCQVFDQALVAYQAGTLDVAEPLFQRVIEQRGADGPSAFYLQQIERARKTELSLSKWTGIIDMAQL